ncbi:MAG: lactate transporter [Actinobacteria bacterium 13_2_20CM_2_71_6]|nr:MAG: lactate transporter [Actinobacteria bacterium 13_2_20CM_2_71_6]
MYRQNFNPTGHLWLSALLAALPLVALLFLLGGLRWKAHWASLTALAVAFLVAILPGSLGFHMPIGLALDSGLFGAVRGVLLVLWITFNAIWIYNMTVDTGHFAVLRRAFARISDDQRVQAIVIAFCFGALIEALAGGGSPIAIASVMLIAIGFSPLKAVAISLVANTAPVAFGGLGNPITVLSPNNIADAERYGAFTGRQTAVLAFIVPFILLYIADGRRGLRQAWPAALTAGVTFSVSQWVFSSISYKLCDIFAALISAVAVLILTRVWKPREELQFDTGRPEPVPVAGGAVDDPAYVRKQGRPEGDSAGDVVKAFAPYAIIVLIFSIAQLSLKGANVKGLLNPAAPKVPHWTNVSWLGTKYEWLNWTTVRFQWPGLHFLPPKGSAESGGTIFTLNWLGATGTLLFLSGLLTMAVLGVGVGRAARIYGRTLRQFNWAILTILTVFALAFVMQFSGQTNTLGEYLATAGGFFAFLSPIVGWFGVAITGTDAGSNALFGPVQASAAASLKTPVYLKFLFGAANSSGGVLAKMISPQNLAIGTAAIDEVGQEGNLFRKVIGWSVGLLVLLCLLVYLQSTPVLGWMVPK